MQIERECARVEWNGGPYDASNRGAAGSDVEERRFQRRVKEIKVEGL
jgi:hypothetical protein